MLCVWCLRCFVLLVVCFGAVVLLSLFLLWRVFVVFVCAYVCGYSWLILLVGVVLVVCRECSVLCLFCGFSCDSCW